MNDSATAALKKTPLFELHEAHDARLVGFAGYAMPVQYPTGIIAEHQHTRARAGLFDVSHMGQFRLRVSDEALEALVPADIAKLAEYHQVYSVLTRADGGIVDDVMITRLPEGFAIVVNAAFVAQVHAHILRELGDGAELDVCEDLALLALQGPRAAAVLEALCPALAALTFMQAGRFTIGGAECLISRSGYTGEDGFEISLPADAACDLAEQLLASPDVAPVGLGARDSLRLEAGLCLSGTDIGPDVSPVEAGLGWLLARKYRGEHATPARFPGAARILEQLQKPPLRRRVGVRAAGRQPLRGGTELVTGDGAAAGRITSGTFGPTAGHPVAMAYVDRRLADPGTKLIAHVRGRALDAEVSALPFVPHRYKRN
jgi:aminomethyltransferase